MDDEKKYWSPSDDKEPEKLKLEYPWEIEDEEYDPEIFDVDNWF